MESAKNWLFELTQWAFALLGMRVAFDYPFRNPNKLLVVKAAELGAGTVLDVGANSGQFARGLRAAGYGGAIVSFEPLSRVHEFLMRAASGDKSWTVMPRMALGDSPGQTRINISRNLASSSLLQVEQLSVDAAPESGFVGTEVVQVNRLDDVVSPLWAAPYTLKLDTQGFELHVLRGASETLQKTALIITELSLAPLYAGGATFLEVYGFLEERGFRCISIVQGFADRKRNEVLQVDGIFVRDNPGQT